MHSLAGGIAAPRSVFRLMGSPWRLRSPGRAPSSPCWRIPRRTTTRWPRRREPSRAFAVAARRAAAGVVDADLLAAETRGLDESHTDATLEPFAGFHAGYLAKSRTCSVDPRASRRGGWAQSRPSRVAAAHAFLGLAREERPTPDVNHCEDEDDESLRRHDASPSPAAPRERHHRDETSNPDSLAPAARAASPEWCALAGAPPRCSRRPPRRRGFGTHDRDARFRFGIPNRVRTESFKSERFDSGDSARAFASDARVSEETPGSLGEPFSFRDAACVAAVSVTPLEETSLEDAFAVARGCAGGTSRSPPRRRTRRPSRRTRVIRFRSTPRRKGIATRTRPARRRRRRRSVCPTPRASRVAG